MDTYEQIAERADLDQSTTARFVRYMRERWAQEEVLQCRTGYASEWAQRFALGIEYAASDSIGKAILDKAEGRG